MLTELTVTYKEMEMLVDALANLRRSEGEMRQIDAIAGKEEMRATIQGEAKGVDTLTIAFRQR